MFEQATLNSAPAGKRALASLLGFATQATVVTVAVLVPMVYPQVLPTARILATLSPPLPPGPPPRPPGSEIRKLPGRPVSVRPTIWNAILVAPTHVPTGAIPVIDEEPAGFVAGLPVGMGGPANGIPGGILQALPSPFSVAPPRIPVPLAAPVVPVPVIRYREGGNVQPGTLLRRVEPPYPAIARAARVSGAVELECVVGVDGRIKDVKVKSGSPLLVRAAEDAAWQWVYAPTKLNGDAVEIVTKLVFTFKLN